MTIAPLIPATMPPGDYAIVELFGHCTLVGRINEVEKFGTKFMVIEPLYAGRLLDPVLHGGSAIYRITPCTPQAALNRAPTSQWSLPTAIRETLPPDAIEYDSQDCSEHDDREPF